MANDRTTVEYGRAAEELLVIQMAGFAERLEFLRHPELVPEDALGAGGSIPPDLQTINLAVWMTDQFVTEAAEVNRDINFGQTFNKFELNSSARLDIKKSLAGMVLESYGPGIYAVSQFAQVAPYVAMREGRDSTVVFDRSRRFGKQVASRTTVEQGLVREHLGMNTDNVPILDPATLTCDDTLSLTSVTPSDLVFEAVREVYYDLLQRHNFSFGRCPAMLSRPASLSTNMFDAVWDVFLDAATNRIYPNLEIDPKKLPRPMKPMKPAALRRQARVNLVTDAASRSLTLGYS